MSFITSQGLPTPVNIGDALVSDGTNFVSSQFLNPIDQTPANAATNQSVTPTLTISSFAALWGRTHTATQWQVSTDSGFATLVVNTGDDASNLTTFTVSTPLAFSTQFWWRARFKNSAGVYSPYSTAFTFTTFTPTVGQEAFTTPGTFTWVAPASGISTLSVVAISGGASGGTSSSKPAGGGGALAYKNNQAITALSSYTVVVGGAGGNSSFKLGGTSIVEVRGGGFGGSRTAGIVITGTGFPGGEGGGAGSLTGGGGGGAGGYSGAGGTGADPDNASGGGGSGGSGGGGASGNYNQGGGAGGGVGILGEGTSGTGGVTRGGGTGGSGGANGAAGSTINGGAAGAYGGGGGGGADNGGAPSGSPGAGAQGAVRIIYPGSTRSFPSTNTGNL
jgi:hypothetical protein